MNIPTDFPMPTINLAKIASFITGLGLTLDQMQLMIDKLSIEQCQELGESMNVFEHLDFGIIDEPEEPDHGDLYVSFFISEEALGSKPSEELVRYPEEGSTEESFLIDISEIIVPTNYDKEQLLLAFKYIHDIRPLDTNIIAVNSLAHMYRQPNKITVINPYYGFK